MVDRHARDRRGRGRLPDRLRACRPTRRSTGSSGSPRCATRRTRRTPTLAGGGLLTAEPDRAVRRHCTSSARRRWRSALLLDPRTTLAWCALLEGLLLGRGEVAHAARPHCRARAAWDQALQRPYGPTETTIWSATQAVDAAEETIPIGGRIANASLPRPRRGAPALPIGSAGDLYIGGGWPVRALRAAGPGSPPSASSPIPSPLDLSLGSACTATGDRGAAPARRHPGVPRPRRPAGQDPRLPHRAGEIEAVLRSRRGARGRGGGAPEDVPRSPGLVGHGVRVIVQRRASSVARASLGQRLPEYMVPLDGHAAGRAARDAERQDRSQRAARAEHRRPGAREHRRRPRSARAGARRHVGGGARTSARSA